MSDSLEQCPVCKLNGQKIIADGDYGDRATYDCSRCGRFTISGTAEAVVKRRQKSAQLSGWLREKSI